MDKYSVSAVSAQIRMGVQSRSLGWRSGERAEYRMVRRCSVAEPGGGQWCGGVYAGGLEEGR